MAIKTLSLYPALPAEKLVLADSSGIRRLRPKKIIGFFLAKAGKFTFKLPGLQQFSGPARSFLYKKLGETDYLNSGRLKKTFVRVVNDNIEGLLDKISSPTLILWGQKDSITPLSEAAVLKQKITNSKLVTIDNTTHFPFLDKPQEFCKIVTDFINE